MFIYSFFDLRWERSSAGDRCDPNRANTEVFTSLVFFALTEKLPIIVFSRG